MKKNGSNLTTNELNNNRGFLQRLLSIYSGNQAEAKSANPPPLAFFSLDLPLGTRQSLVGNLPEGTRMVILPNGKPAIVIQTYHQKGPTLFTPPVTTTTPSVTSSPSQSNLEKPSPS